MSKQTGECNDSEFARRGLAKLPYVHADLMMRSRWIVLGAWLLVMAGIIATGVPSFGREGLSLEELASPDSPEVRTEVEALELFRIPLNAREQIVRRDEQGLSNQVRRADVAAAISGTREVHDGRAKDDTILLQLPFVNTGGAFPASRESSTTTITNLFGNPKRSLGAQVRAGEKLADQARERGEGNVNLTGGIPAQLRMGAVVRDSLGLLQVASAVLLVLITLLWFRALAPSLVVISTIAATMLLMLEALAFLTDTLGIGVPAEVLPVVLVVAIGVASDYALFHIVAWSRLTREGMSAEQATRETIALNAPVVLTAGATTSLGAASLLLAQTPFIRAFAPALMASILVAIVVGLLLVPALVSVLGGKLLWPRRLRYVPTESRGIVQRFADSVTRPKAAVVVVLTTIVALSVLGMNAVASPLGFNVITALPDDDPIVLGARDAGKGFAPGILSPTLLVIDGKRLDERANELSKFTAAVEQLDGVGGVIGPESMRRSIQESGAESDLDQIGVELAGTDASRGRAARKLAKATLETKVVQQATRNMLVTKDGAHARLVVVLDHEAYTGNAVRTLAKLRPKFRAALDDAGLHQARLRVAGDTALIERITIQMNADLLRIAAFLIPLELIILLIFLRSVVLSMILVLSGLMTTIAAIGVLSIVDRTVGAGDGIAFFVPVSAFVLLLSIGLDYGVLTGNTLLRIRKQDRQGMDAARGTIIEAYPSVVLAGIVIASTFALLGTVNLDSFRQVAIVMCAGVLIDSLLVRPIVVPLLLALKEQGISARSSSNK